MRASTNDPKIKRPRPARRIDLAPLRADDRANLRTLSLTKIGAVCAILVVVCFVAFFVFMASMGVALLRRSGAPEPSQA